MKNTFIEKKIKAFREKFVKEDNWRVSGHIGPYVEYPAEELEQFLSTALQEAQEEERKKIVNVRKDMSKDATCAIICSDGSGKPVEKHLQGCPYA